MESWIFNTIAIKEVTFNGHFCKFDDCKKMPNGVGYVLRDAKLNILKGKFWKTLY